MPNLPLTAGRFFRKIVEEFLEDGCMTLAAALAFYAVFSIPPLVLIVMTVTSLLWNEQVVREHLQTELVQLLGAPGTDQLFEMMRAAQRLQQGPLAMTIHIIVLLVGSTSLLTELQVALNKVWNVRSDPRNGAIRQMLIKRALSFGVILVVAALLLASLVLTTVLGIVVNSLNQMLPGEYEVLLTTAGHGGITFLIVMVLFALLFKWLPDVRIPWFDIWVGAAVTGLLFLLGKNLLGFYLGRLDLNAYGAGGALVLLLTWVYYNTMILLLGAEFTEVFARTRGSRIVPAPGYLVQPKASTANAPGVAAVP
ncbi:YihY/virulence factor BrkB family protein [Planctomicrobium sp. SH664]|uniref:YihY/virulence factor BrkB family protein n=1 Tax=Planctomicrobium sp. SH664 TaxID=3448125 RepID=UPI003F5B72A9